MRELALRAWNQAKKLHHHPVMDDPLVVKKHPGGASYDFKTRETLLGKDFVKETCEATGISEEDCLLGLSIHEISHYMDFPYTLANLIFTGNLVDRYYGEEDKDTRGSILQMLCDMCADVKSVMEGGKGEPILRLREASQQTLKDELNGNVRGVMLAVLQLQAGKKPELDEELKPFFEKMLKISFGDRSYSAIRMNVLRFGRIILDMMKKYGGKGGGKGQKQITLRPYGPRDTDIKEILDKATQNEIREALREIALNVDAKGEYELVKEWLGEEMGANIPNAPHPFSIGTSSGELEVDTETMLWYKELSKKYPLAVSKKLLDTTKEIRTWHEIEKWRSGSDPNLALTGSSGGKLLPGITRKVKNSTTPIKSRDWKVPHKLVIIDTSGSMPHPKFEKSHAVLGAFCDARSSHTNDAYVGVINFSGDSFYLPYTRELDHALGAISAFQGGGTVADIDMIRMMLGDKEAGLFEKFPDRNLKGLPKKYLKKEISIGLPKEALEAESIDVTMFTDGGIFNLNELLDLFEERDAINRATIVLSKGFQQDIDEIKRRKIKLCQVDKDEDIPLIAVRENQLALNAMQLV